VRERARGICAGPWSAGPGTLSLPLICLCERDNVFERERGRESVCLRERGRESVFERERECVCVLERGRARKCV